MKINQIISEDESLDEAPVGLLKRTGHKIASKLGSRGSQAKLDVANDANQMKSDLKTWMAGSGIKKGQLSVADFKNFLSQKGLPSDQVDGLLSQMRQNPDGTYKAGGMTNKEVDNILRKAVQQGFKSTGASGSKSRFAQKASTASRSAGSEIPNSIINAIGKLTPQQKAALKSML